MLFLISAIKGKKEAERFNFFLLSLSFFECGSVFFSGFGKVLLGLGDLDKIGVRLSKCRGL